MKKTLLICAIIPAFFAITGCNEKKEEAKNVVSPASSAVVVKPENFETITSRLNIPAYGAVDVINGVVAPKDGSVIPINGEKVEIGGNYVDEAKGEAAAAVIVLIDNKPYVATYGGERPDIAQAHNNQKFLKSQFSLEVPTATVGKGIHDVKVRVIASDKSGYYESAWSAKIDVK